MAFPIETAPRDGRKLLIYGTTGWESLNDHRPEKQWRVAYWYPELAVDYESENYDYMGGWKTVTSNPYCDYMIATHWLPYPDEPA